MTFIASGSYGCVFKPHLPCKDKTHVKHAVGKVFADEEDFHQEMDMNNDVINRIDPDHEFTLPVLAACDVQISNDQCELITNTHPRKQIIMSDGGHTLEHLIYNKHITMNKFVKVLRAFEPIFKGLVMIADHGYIHQDIKLENILYKKNKLYLIDFGIASDIKTHYSQPFRSMLKADYLFFPPEYKLFTKKHKTFDSYISSVLRNFIFSISIAKKTARLTNVMLCELDIDIHEELRKMWLSKPIPSTEYARKVDTYQLGIVLLCLWRAVNNKKHQDHIVSLIKGMVHPNVMERYTPEKSLDVYTKLIGIL